MVLTYGFRRAVKSLLAVFLLTATAAVFLLTATARAQIIRDTEIENALRHYSYPLIKQAGLDVRTVRLHIINNDSLNAFVSGGQRIFMHSGTLIEAESPDEVLSVLAHEIGHIEAGHLAGLHEESKASGRAALLSVLVGVPLALLSGDAGAAIGSTLIGGRIAQGRLLNYTQSMESSADQAALRYLRGENISAQGMVDFLHRMKRLEEIYGTRAAYLRSHPLTEERIWAAESALAKEQNARPINKVLRLIHARVRGKLIGHLWEHSRVTRSFPASDNSVTARYARAFSYMLKGLHENALAEIDALLAAQPGDIFYLEAKGDIYRNQGRMAEARRFYGQALERAPWAALIHSQWANSLTFDERRDPALVAQALEHARAALAREPRLYPAWQAKAALETARGNGGLADVAEAEAALLRRDVERALFLARRAADKLATGTAEQRQAEDIIHRALQIKGDS